MCEGRRSPYKIDNSRSIRKTFESFEQVRQKLVAVWSTPEKSAKMSYIIGYLNCFRDNHGQHDGIIILIGCGLFLCAFCEEI